MPSVFGECLTLQNPPCKTSVSTDASHLRRISFVLIGSILRFNTFAGSAVLPTVLIVMVDGFAEARLRALILNTRSSYVPFSLLNISKIDDFNKTQIDYSEMSDLDIVKSKMNFIF